MKLTKKAKNKSTLCPDLDWMCSRDFSAVLSQASVTFSISDLSRTSKSLFMGLNRPERDDDKQWSFPASWLNLGQHVVKTSSKKQKTVCLVCLCELTSNIAFVAVVNLF